MLVKDLLGRILGVVKTHPEEVFLLLIVVYLAAWLGETFGKVKPDLSEYRAFLMFYGGYVGLIHTNNSLFNSPRGKSMGEP